MSLYTHTIHKDAVPIVIEGNKQVGWSLETPDYKMQAIEDADHTINVYLTWTDDRSGDMTNHRNWFDVSAYLRGLNLAIEQGKDAYKESEENALNDPEEPDDEEDLEDLDE